MLAIGCANGHVVRPDSGQRDGGPPVDAPIASQDTGPSCEGVDCSSLDGPCAVGACDPSDGTCVAMPVADGTSCDDGDACTTGDACAAGSCAGVAMDCSALDSACAVGVCGDGTCVTMPRPDGTICDDADACTAGDACASGVCTGVATDCSALDGACVAGACDPSTGGCVATPRADGTSCDDANTCTVLDACASGACTGSPVSCSALDGPCVTGVCSAGTGGCVAMTRPAGTPCDDGNPATAGDVCSAGGTCAGTPVGGCGGGALVPGRTDLVVGQGGWCVRCLSWSGSTCTHLQGRMDCAVCTAYPSCAVWHDVTDFNDSDNRSSVNWCALATGNAGIVSKGSGGTAVAPRACGWGSTVHPLCEATRATFHVPVTGVPAAHGALLDESYCSASPRLLYLDCVGW